MKVGILSNEAGTLVARGWCVLKITRRKEAPFCDPTFRFRLSEALQADWAFEPVASPPVRRTDF